MFTIFTLCLKKLVAEEEEVIEKNTDITQLMCIWSFYLKNELGFILHVYLPQAFRGFSTHSVDYFRKSASILI